MNKKLTELLNELKSKIIDLSELQTAIHNTAILENSYDELESFVENLDPEFQDVWFALQNIDF